MLKLNRVFFIAGSICFFTTMMSYASQPLSPFAGPYLGMTAGWGSGSSGYRTDPGCPQGSDAVFCNALPDPSAPNGVVVASSGSGKFKLNGINVGGQVGYNWASDRIVYGAEADLTSLDWNKSTTESGAFPFIFLGNRYTVKESVSTQWISTIRGRLGVAVRPQLLVYATSGVAFTDVKFSSSYSDNAIGIGFPGGNGHGDKSEIRTAWTIGGGGEWHFNEMWSIKAEYLYADFGAMHFSVPVSNTPGFMQIMQLKTSLKTRCVRLGLNYRF